MTKLMPIRLLTIGFSSVLALLSPPSIAAGSSRPASNPFESSAGVNVENWAQANGKAQVNVIVSSNIAGKLGLCGCSVNPKGGMDRRLNFIESKKALSATSLVLDAGNALFASRNLDPSLAEKQRARAHEIAAAHRDLGIEAQNVGILDLSSGVDFVLSVAKQSKLRFLSTNLVRESNSTAPFEVAYTKDVPGIGKVLVLGLTAIPKEGYEGLKSLEPATVVRAQIAKVQPAATVVLSDLGQSDDLNLMAAVKSPLVVVGARDLNAIDIPLHSGAGVLVQPGIQGQQEGVFSFSPRGNFTSWRNLTQDKALATRWNQLSAELRDVQQLESSEDKKTSLARIEDSFRELGKYAKGDAKGAWAYAYELHDMDERYAQKNKLTKLSLEDQ